MVKIASGISLDDSELHEEFIRAAGPGGQNVNKVSSAVQLRFDVAHSPSLPDHVRERLLVLAGKNMNKDGVLLIAARRFRNQGANRQDAIDRLVALIQKAARQPVVRHRTKPTLASKERKLEVKHLRAAAKRLRGSAVEINGD